MYRVIGTKDGILHPLCVCKTMETAKGKKIEAEIHGYSDVKICPVYPEPLRSRGGRNSGRR
jgi:hypothetical protein